MKGHCILILLERFCADDEDDDIHEDEPKKTDRSIYLGKGDHR